MANASDVVPVATQVAIPFALGLLAGGAGDPTTASPAFVVTVAAVGASLAGMRIEPRPFRRALLAAVAAGLAVGSLAAALAHLPLAPDHLARLAGPGNVAVEGTVVASERSGERLSLVVAAERVRSRRRTGPASGSLGVTIAHAHGAWPLGSGVRLVGRLRRPRGFGNPNDYDLAAALARRGIYVTMFLWDERDVVRTSAPAASTAPLAHLRTAAETRIAALTDEPVRGYLDAVLLGATTSIDRRTRTALTRTGLAHVVSVSGFHIAVAAGACLVLGQWLLLRVDTLALRCDVTKLAATMGMLPVGVYAAIAGGSVPAARAFITYGVGLGALACDRPPDGPRALAFAAALLALSAPDVASDISFQLSFVSVLALLAIAHAAAATTTNEARATPVRWRRLVVESLRVSVAATLATAPLTAWHFQQVSLVAPVANLLALPLLGPATLLPGLAALPLTTAAPALADPLLAAAGMAAGLGLRIADRLAAPSWAAVATPMPSGFEVALCYATLALWWLPRLIGAMPARRRHAALALVAALWLGDGAYWLWARFGDATVRVTFLSVGQGDAAVVELPHGGTMVIDGGGFPGDFDPGERLIAPFLRSRKILHLDVIALSHPQLDHYGGLAYLAEHFTPREFWFSGLRSTSPGFARLEAALRDAGAASVITTRGMRRLLHDVVIDVLHPQRIDSVDVNDTSLVLRLAYGTTSLLFTGDVERGAEREMLAAGEVATSTVLKVAHHGSATSSTAAWLAAVAPTVAVISSGADNRFGFPARTVVGRLRVVGAAVFNTADDGAVRVVSDGRRVDVTPTRARAP